MQYPPFKRTLRVSYSAPLTVHSTTSHVEGSPLNAVPHMCCSSSISIFYEESEGQLRVSARTKTLNAVPYMTLVACKYLLRRKWATWKRDSEKNNVVNARLRKRLF